MKRGLIIIALLVVVTALLSTGDSVSHSLLVESLLDDAVQDAIDEAVFQQAPLLEEQVDFPRPTAEAERLLLNLAISDRPDPRILRELANVQLQLLKIQEAEQTMRRLAETHPDSGKGLQELADFYHGRLRISDEVKVLQQLADQSEDKEKIKLYRKILNLLDDYLLESFDRELILRAMITAQPDSAQHAETLITYLAEQGRLQDALAETEAAVDRRPERRRGLMELKADILREEGRAEEAISVYRVQFDPVKDLELFNDYLSLLRRLDRYQEYERGLRRRARLKQLDDQGQREFFLLMRSQRRYEEAAKALNNWIDSIGSLSPVQLKEFAEAYAAVGETLSAWRLTYTYYVTTTGSEAKESALLRLFELTWELPGSEQNLTGKGIGTYINPRHLDNGPGVVGGLLSLFYNKQEIPEKLEDLQRVSRDLENRKLLMWIFEQFGADYPDSKGLAGMYASVVRMFNDYNQPKTAVSYAEQFMESFQDGKRFYEVAEEAIAAYQRLNKHQAIRDLYEDLLRRADRLEERDKYLKYLGSLERYHAGRREYAAAIEQYWTEINAHLKDAVLYQRFLEFLGRYNIYDEELKVYRRAIKHFDEKSYYHKLARWYVRQRRTADLQDLTRQIADIFSDSELAEFFRSFVERGRNASDPDSVFFRTMYEYANRRFPRDIRFVNGLLDFYQRFELWAEFDQLSKKYFYASEAIRQGWIRSLSRRGLLEATLRRLEGGGNLPLGSAGSSFEDNLPSSPAELLLLAELARWNSLFEAALPIYERLVTIYPGNEEVVNSHASLQRSFGHSSAAVKTYAALEQLFPHNKDYYTAAGEILIEEGKAAEAADHWVRIIEIMPSDSDLYLEVASIFWDYYQFERSAEIFLTARRRLEEPTLFGPKLAAVYESAKNYQNAIAEYVRTLSLEWDRYYERGQTLQRLVYLAERKGLSADIDSEFASAVREASRDHRFVQAFAEYLKLVGKNEHRRELLRGAIDRYNNREFMGRLADLFRRERNEASEERALHRLIAISGEDASNLLALANFLERSRRLPEAESIFQRRVEMTRTDEPEELPDYLSTLDEAAGFAWRHESYNKAFNYWMTAARAASGTKRTSRLHALSQRYIQQDRYQDATAVLEELLDSNPSSVAYFNSLAQIYTRKEDYPGLAALYRRAIDAVRADRRLGSEAKTQRIIDLRLGLIENLEKFGDFTAALDQYIEIINRRFDDAGMLATAWRFAARHDLTERLLSYYRQTSEKSFKDHRWNVVLAGLLEMQNQLPDAEQEWRKAIRNEPQRIELHSALVEVLLKLQRYAEAVDVYKQIYRLDDRNIMWQFTIARTHALAGDMESARETLESILVGGAPGYRKYFEVAGILEEWGELEAATQKLETGLAELRADIYKQRLEESDLNMILRVGLKTGKAVETFNALLDLNAVYAREASRDGNARAWEARQGQRITYNAFSGSFARALKEYANDSQRREIAQRLVGFLDRFPNDAGTASFVRNAARQMNFAEVTDRAIRAELGHLNNYNQRFNYRREILNALDYYALRGNWRGAAEMLERELSRSTLFNFRGEIFSVLTDLYRYGGDGKKEIETLRKYVAFISGNELGLSRIDPLVDRYLSLLLRTGDESGLKDSARTVNAYTGQMINFFLANKRADLAALAVDAASLRRSPKWRDSKKLLIEAYADSPASGLGERAPVEELLGFLPIEKRLDSKPDKQRVLVGGEWFGFAGHFAHYLFKVAADPRYKGFVIAPAESQSRDSRMQREVARWYSAHELYDEALGHYELALQLGGDKWSTYAEMGELHLKRDDQILAMQTWSKIIEGEAGLAALARYHDVLSRNGFAEHSVPPVLDYLKKAIPKSFNYDLREFVWNFVESLKEDEALDYVIDSLTSIYPETDEPIEYLRYFLEYLSLPDRLTKDVYSLIINVAEEVGEVDEESLDLVNTVLRYWLEQGIEFAVNADMPKNALEWARRYEANEFHDSSTSHFSRNRYYWQLKARALLATDRKTAALDTLSKVYETVTPRLNRYQIAHEILLDAGADVEAENLMIGYYREALSRGYESTVNYTGLAAILLDRASRSSTSGEGKSGIEEALALLDRMVNMAPNNEDGMREAAELLERRDLHSQAAHYRKMLYRLNPRDHHNTLALAKNLVSTGDDNKALELLRGLLIEQQAPRSIKVEALMPFVKLIEDRPERAEAEMSVFETRKQDSELDSLVFAELARIDGQLDVFKGSMDSGLIAFLEPALLAKRRAEIALEEGNSGKAIELLATALRYEPEAESRLLLLKNLLAGGLRARALQLLDAYRYSGLYWGEYSQVGESLGLKDPELLELYDSVVGAAIAVGLYDTAESLERQRIALAGSLRVKIRDRLKEIEELRRQEEPPKPPVRIVDDIANRADMGR